MKCVRCGNEIEEGKLYCSVCGAEARLVPDYNELEDELLDIVSGKENEEDAVEDSPQNENNHLLSAVSIKAKLAFIFAVAIVVVFVVGINFIVTKITEEAHYNSFDYQMQMGDEAFDSSEYEEALGYYKRAVQLKADNPDALLKIAEVKYATGDKEGYEKDLYTVLDLCDDKTLICKMLIEYYDETEDYDKILELCSKINDPKLLYLFSDYIVPAPVFNTAGGTYYESFELEIKYDSEYTVFYTLDGSDPSVNGYLYDDTITIDEGSVVVKAVCVNSNGVYSDIAEEEYEVILKPLEGPKASIPSGDYPDGGEISLTCDEGFVIFYTWDGQEPNELSNQYVSPLLIPDGSSVLSCIGITTEGKKTPVTRYYYNKYPIQ